MSSTNNQTQREQMIDPKRINFYPEEFNKIKETLLRRIDVIARAFCETEQNISNAIKSGQARIGTLNDNFGRFCIYIEYQGIEVLKPVHVLH